MKERCRCLWGASYQGVVWQSEQLTLENVDPALLDAAQAFGNCNSLGRAVSPGRQS